MDITLKIADGGELGLSAIKNGDGKSYRLINLADKKSYMYLKIDNNKFKIIEKDDIIIDEEDVLESKLDELLLAVIEGEQSGIEGGKDEDVDENPYDPDKIRVDTRNFSLKNIYDMIENGDIDLSPDFQRYFVWDNTRQSRLIESILLRIPLPMFYFAQDDDGRITVVDGLQRLSTIKKFMDNNLALKNLEYLDKCEGKYYGKPREDDMIIDAKYFRWFNMTQIVVNVIDPQSPPKVKYDIFRRINTGGKPLNWQEIRNCLSKPYIRKLLIDMAGLGSFSSATLGSIKDTRMEAQELALRFIVFHDYYYNSSLDGYSGNMVSSLDLKIEELNKRDKESVNSYVSLFDKAMQNAEYLFGRYAFRKCLIEHIEDPNSRKQLINKALFISWSVLLSQYDVDKIKAGNEAGILAKPLAENITNSQEFFNFLTYGTNARANINAAFHVAQEIIETNLKY